MNCDSDSAQGTYVCTYHGQLNAREQIHIDANEEGNILLKEFRQIDINNGAQNNLRFRQVSIKATQ